jgi:hypothetical protein
MTVEITYATPIPIKSIKATCCRRGRGMTEIVALVEALIGAKWEPTKAGNVRVHRRPDTPVDGGGE